MPRTKQPKKQSATKTPRAKRAEVPSAAPAARTFTIRGPETRGDGATYLAREDLLQIQLIEARTAAALQAIALRRLETERMTARHEQEKRAAQAELAALVAHGKAQEERAATLWAELGAVYRIDFKHASYDDETGRLAVQEPPQEVTRDGTS